MSHTCPKCNSDQIQTFRMAFEGGTSTGVSHTTGVGVGVGSGGGLGLGIGGAKTTSTNMSLTAQKVAPPEKMSLKWMLGIAIFGFLAIYSSSDVRGSNKFVMILFGLGALGFGSYKAYQIFQWNRQKHPELMAQWERSWLCHKCGNTFEL